MENKRDRPAVTRLIEDVFCELQSACLHAKNSGNKPDYLCLYLKEEYLSDETVEHCSTDPYISATVSCCKGHDIAMKIAVIDRAITYSLYLTELAYKTTNGLQETD